MGSRVASGEFYPTQAPIHKCLKLVAVDASYHRWRSMSRPLFQYSDSLSCGSNVSV